MCTQDRGPGCRAHQAPSKSITSPSVSHWLRIFPRFLPIGWFKLEVELWVAERPTRHTSRCWWHTSGRRGCYLRQRTVEAVSATGGCRPQPRLPLTHSGKHMVGCATVAGAVWPDAPPPAALQPSRLISLGRTVFAVVVTLQTCSIC